MNKWLLLSAAIVGETIATSALKSSEGFTKLIPSIIVVIGYGISFFLLAKILSMMPVSIAYAIWSGAGIALITFIGWVFFKQKLDLPAVIGLLLIIAGVIVINLFSKVAAH